MDFLKEISPKFTEQTYNVISNNCNNFTDECANFLLGISIPSDILDLPKILLSTPMGKMIAPMMN
jgi:hypothetical protein